jgi:hypothetical protein
MTYVVVHVVADNAGEKPDSDLNFNAWCNVMILQKIVESNPSNSDYVYSSTCGKVGNYDPLMPHYSEDEWQCKTINLYERPITITDAEQATWHDTKLGTTPSYDEHYDNYLLDTGDTNIYKLNIPCYDVEYVHCDWYQNAHGDWHGRLQKYDSDSNTLRNIPDLGWNKNWDQFAGCTDCDFSFDQAPSGGTAKLIMRPRKYSSLPLSGSDIQELLCEPISPPTPPPTSPPTATDGTPTYAPTYVPTQSPVAIPVGTNINVHHNGDGDNDRSDDDPKVFCNVMIYRYESSSHSMPQDNFCDNYFPGYPDNELECVSVALPERYSWITGQDQMGTTINNDNRKFDHYQGTVASGTYTHYDVSADANIYELPFGCGGITHVHCQHTWSGSYHNFELKGWNKNSGGIYDLREVTDNQPLQTYYEVGPKSYYGWNFDGSTLHLLKCGQNTLAPTKAPTPPTKAPTTTPPTRSPTVTPTGGCLAKETIEVCAPPHLSDCG